MTRRNRRSVAAGLAAGVGIGVSTAPANALVLTQLGAPFKVGLAGDLVIQAVADGNYQACNYDACIDPRITLDVFTDNEWITMDTASFLPGGDDYHAGVEGSCVPRPDGAGREYRNRFSQTVRDAPAFRLDTADANSFLACPSPK
jgi:hypothetical protein